MTHKSLFKEAAQHFVQRGQMSDAVPQSVGQTMASQPASRSGASEPQMNARALRLTPGQQEGLSETRTDR
jgi:hypothetical protein